MLGFSHFACLRWGAFAPQISFITMYENSTYVFFVSSTMFMVATPELPSSTEANGPP